MKVLWTLLIYADVCHHLDWRDEDLPVAVFTSPRLRPYCRDYGLHLVILDNHHDHHLGDQVDGNRLTPVLELDTFLRTPAADL